MTGSGGAVACFSDVVINHHRDAEGYTDQWFDAVDMDEAQHIYKFTVPQDAQINANDALYVTVEGYYSEVIPMSCFMENSGQSRQHPIQDWRVDNVTPNGAKMYAYYIMEDMMHTPAMITQYDAGAPDAGGFEAGGSFEVRVTYTWHDSPFKDYTVKVYSHWDTPVSEIDANGAEVTASS